MVNNVTLVGRLTKDIEVKKTTSGLSTCTFTVACNRPKSKDGTEQTDFISCVAWRQAAEFLGQYAKKGALVSVEGRIQTRNYDGADGKKVYVTEILANTVHILSAPKQEQAEPVPHSTYRNTNNHHAYLPGENEFNEMGGYVNDPDLPF